MQADSRSRKWQITINNPIDKGYTHDKIVEILKEFKSIVYYCMSDEIGEAGTYHTHIFIAASSGIRFSTLLNRFEKCHFEMANGNCQQNRDYVFKEGKWSNDKKAETNLKDTHLEFGELPVERQGKRNDLDDLYDMIKSGMTTLEIVEVNPSYMLYLDKIDKLRMQLRAQQFKVSDRNVSVVYVFGLPGVGKTSGILNAYGRENCYRVTDYKHPFDTYENQSVLVFDEFYGQLSLPYMLNLTDRYPLELSCRYQNRTACYEKVFIISNVGLDKLYQTEQREMPLQYDALLRRIGHIMIYDKNGNMEVKPRKEVYLTSYEQEEDFVSLPDNWQESLPFA